MRKGIFFVIFVLCFTVLNSKTNLSYGIKTGVSIANQDYNFTYIDGLETKHRYGFDIGTFAELMITNNFIFQFEVHYIQKGTYVIIDVRDENGEHLDSDVAILVNYIEFNFLPKLKINLSYLKPYIFGGPVIDVFIGHNNEWGCFDSCYDDFNKIDLGVSLGLGAGFQLSKHISSLLEIKFSPTLTKPYKEDFLEISNHSFEILTGIKF